MSDAHCSFAGHTTLLSLLTSGVIAVAGRNELGSRSAIIPFSIRIISKIPKLVVGDSRPRIIEIAVVGFRVCGCIPVTSGVLIESPGDHSDPGFFPSC